MILCIGASTIFAAKAQISNLKASDNVKHKMVKASNQALNLNHLEIS